MASVLSRFQKGLRSRSLPAKSLSTYIHLPSTIRTPALPSPVGFPSHAITTVQHPRSRTPRTSCPSPSIATITTPRKLPGTQKFMHVSCAWLAVVIFTVTTVVNPALSVTHNGALSRIILCRAVLCPPLPSPAVLCCVVLCRSLVYSEV